MNKQNIYQLILSLFLLSYQCLAQVDLLDPSLANLVDITLETRFCQESQIGGTDEEFANRLLNYVKSCDLPTQSTVNLGNPVTEEDIIVENPILPIFETYDCGTGYNLGWMLKIVIQDEVGSNFNFDFLTDLGLGTAVFIDNQLVIGQQTLDDVTLNENNVPEISVSQEFTPGEHTILVVGQEEDCTLDLGSSFSKDTQSEQNLSAENIVCALTNNCIGVVCEVGTQWQDGADCIDCPYQCGTCVNNEICYTCSHISRSDIPDCNCSDGYYNIEGQAQCGSCKSSCATCNNPNQCLTCEETHYLASDSSECIACNVTYGAQCGKCNQTECLECTTSSYQLPNCDSSLCQSNQFLVVNLCVDCSPNCQTCSDLNQCTSCLDSEYLLQGICISCQTTYGNHCGTCDSNKCLSCQVNPTFKLDDCTTDSCLPNQAEVDNRCYDCEQNCEQCSDSTTCTQCIQGTYLENGDCFECVSPCLECTSQTACTTCEKPNYSLESGCTLCNDGYFSNNSECVSCQTHYGENCAKCDENECTECLNNQEYALPDCVRTECPDGQYLDQHVCRDCMDSCLTCSDGNTCDSCQDLLYLENGNCHECQSPCFMCSNSTECEVCDQVGYQPPSCTGCEENWFYNSDTNECLQVCEDGYYGNRSDNSCQKCDDTCITCYEQSYICLSCPNGQILMHGECLECSDFRGMEQIPDKPAGMCREICGKGFRFTDEGNICDDGNNINGDGCSSDCEVEEGWTCDGGDSYNRDYCVDSRPISFSVGCEDQNSQVLNIEEQATIFCQMDFNKQFVLPEGKTLDDYIVIRIEGKDDAEFSFKLKELKDERRRILESVYVPKYSLEVEPKTTMKNRKMVIDLEPKSDFSDGHGNSLSEENDNQNNVVKEYYYYTPEERKDTSNFEIWLQIGIALLLLFLPFYVFVYRNHFNRFYILFVIVDIIQILYFYRFINIRWPINGIKFFRRLRPCISFFMWNFYEIEIPEEDFEKYSSGVLKFDSERESALFLNNAGSMLTWLFILIILYGIVVLFSQKPFYNNNEDNKAYKFFSNLKHGYFQWGIWFDCMLASSGVFIVYFFLQMTNANKFLDFSIALLVAILYFGFFGYVLRFLYKNKEQLYTVEYDETIDDMSLQQKLKANSTFKFRNIWHFIYQIKQYPKKSMFYFVFVFRKVFIAIVLLSLQTLPGVQITLFMLSHLCIIIMTMKWKFFKQKKETWRTCTSELFVLIGVGCMYFLLDDESEDEHFRLKYCWYAVASLLISLLIQAIFFFYNDILEPLYYYLVTAKGRKKVTNLREARQEGKQGMVVNPIILEKMQQEVKKAEEQTDYNSQRYILSQENQKSPIINIHDPAQNIITESSKSIRTPKRQKKQYKKNRLSIQSDDFQYVNTVATNNNNKNQTLQDLQNQFNNYTESYNYNSSNNQANSTTNSNPKSDSNNAFSFKKIRQKAYSNNSQQWNSNQNIQIYDNTFNGLLDSPESDQNIKPKTNSVRMKQLSQFSNDSERSPMNDGGIRKKNYSRFKKQSNNTIVE